MRYLACDWTGVDGEPGAFYGAEGELSREAVQEATDAWAEDRHYFRLIISPEHGDRIEDLWGYVREVMADVGSELKGPGLEWIAINHFDTDQPHAHVLIRGRFAVVERGIALAAVSEMPGQEMVFGQVLGLGMQR